MDRLNEKEAQYFYDLFIPLLEYINAEKKVTDQLVIRDEENPDEFAIDPQNVFELTEAAYDDLSIIDRYLSHAEETLSKEDREIVKSWKRAYQGTLTIVNYTDDGALLLDDDYNVLLVKGIYSSIQEITGYVLLPGAV